MGAGFPAVGLHLLHGQVLAALRFANRPLSRNELRTVTGLSESGMAKAIEALTLRGEIARRQDNRATWYRAAGEASVHGEDLA